MNDWSELKRTNLVPASTFKAAHVGKTFYPGDKEYPIRPSDAFRTAFPRLTSLLVQARVTPVEMRIEKREGYYLLGWTNAQGKSIGWLCLRPYKVANDRRIHPDHRLVLTCIGGIKECWNQPEGLLNNLYTAIDARPVDVGFGGYEDHYRYSCRLEGMKPSFDPADYVIFAREANGTTHVYQSRSGEVLVYAPEGGSADLEILNGCPEHTLYTLRGIRTFRDWIETMANQWLQVLSEPHSEMSGGASG